MARIARLKYHDPRDGYYHIISRTVLKSFLLDDEARDTFLGILQMLARVYFVKVVTFSLMNNHFHLILRMLPSAEIDDRELEERFNIYYNEGKQKRNWRSWCAGDATRYRFRFADLSRFVQDLKQRFSRWHNRKNDNHGHVWSERFKSVMLEDGRALLACMVYVELNSIRAGLVERPEEFRFCGLNHLLAGGIASSWLDHETLTRLLNSSLLPEIQMNISEDTKLEMQKVRQGYTSNINQYLALIYREGKIEQSGNDHIRSDISVSEQPQPNNINELGFFPFLQRWHHFSSGVFVGSKNFCTERFKEFKEYFQTSGDREGQRIVPKNMSTQGSLHDLFAIRRFPNKH